MEYTQDMTKQSAPPTWGSSDRNGLCRHSPLIRPTHVGIIRLPPTVEGGFVELMAVGRTTGSARACRIPEFSDDQVSE